MAPALGTFGNREHSILCCLDFLRKLLLARKESTLLNPTIAGGKGYRFLCFLPKQPRAFSVTHSEELCKSMKLLGQLGRRNHSCAVLGETSKN